MIFLGALALIFAIDVLVKAYIEKTKQLNESESKCGGLIEIRHTKNYGFAGSRLKARPKCVCLLHCIAMLFLSAAYIHLLRKEGNSLLKLSGAFVLGGGASNLYDRLRKGAVTDYISFNVPVKSIKRLVFNISDFFIFAGGIIGIIFSLRDGLK